MKLNRIRAVLEDKGCKPNMVCKEVGKKFQCMTMLYVCKLPQPNLTTLLEIAQLLSVDMKELITNEKERNV